MEEIIHIKGREGLIVGFVSILVLILLVIPLVLIFFFKIIGIIITAIREESVLPQIVTAKLERLY